MLRTRHCPAPTFHNTTSYSTRSFPSPIFTPRVGFVSLSTCTMAQPGIPIFPAPLGGTYSASMSTADIEQKDCFIYHWLHQQNVSTCPDVTLCRLVPLDLLVHYPAPRSHHSTRTLG